ncbi:hypothetical protein MPH_12275 [Macrophomina phaseolina MS6]|uniref:Uncharacterized protein n=1 Tax=Macrophomina phaseolina (strain MS6) TaxID=1126212 RepID=K2R8F1_MACPH|nr:hypothetical protein MPH_12275 [Macrophomina phaseolina MS6]
MQDIYWACEKHLRFDRSLTPRSPRSNSFWAASSPCSAVHIINLNILLFPTQICSAVGSLFPRARTNTRGHVRPGSAVHHFSDCLLPSRKLADLLWVLVYNGLFRTTT